MSKPAAVKKESPLALRAQLQALVPELAAACAPVYLATEPDELQAVYEFRYRIYIEEFGYTIAEADGEQRTIREETDGGPGALVLYTRDNEGSITGTARLAIWGPGEMPEPARSMYATDLFAGLHDHTTAELTRLMIAPGARGAGGLISIALACYELAARAGVAALFQYCAPGLAPYYRHLGLRPYGSKLTEIEDGAYVPMVMFPFDHESLAGAGSMLAPLAALAHIEGLETSRFAATFEPDSLPVCFDQDEVLAAAATVAREADCPGGALAGLAPEALRTLCADAFVLQLGAGALLTGAGVKQREVFVVLDGELVREAPGSTTLCGRGSLVGHEGYLRVDGIRQAAVRALSAARVLVIRPGAIRKLSELDPASAATLMARLRAETNEPRSRARRVVRDQPVVELSATC